MKSNVRNIHSIDEVDAIWMTDALRAGGILPDAIHVKEIGVKKLASGFMAETRFFDLTYSEPSGDLPKSVVGKFPSDNPSSRATGSEMNSYAIEVNFYRDLAPNVGMRTAECYFAQVDEESGAFGLLIEDLRPGTNIPFNTFTVDQGKLAVREAAALHASTWNREDVFRLDWLDKMSDAGHQADTARRFESGMNVINQFMREDIPTEYLEYAQMFARKLPVWFDAMNDIRAVAHSDFRCENLIFSKHGGSQSLVTVDMQTLRVGSPLLDVSYFAALDFGIEERRAIEMKLLEHYFEALQEFGVKDFGWHECVLQYKKSTLYGVLMAILTCHAIGKNGLPVQTRAYIANAMHLMFSHAMDHKALDLI